MTTPSLPAFDPEGALAGIDASPSGGVGSGRRGDRRSTESSGAGASGSDRGDARHGDATADGGSSDDDSVRTRSERDADRRKDHPLSDVWGDG
jgi:hypothetical protein